MYAKIPGRVDVVNGAVEVSNCYLIKGDADLSVGDVDFDGFVLIKGNVISDLTIKASGSIEVYGFVEGARLIAGRDITLRSGIQGNDKGVLEAGGDVTAKYIERTKVQAGGNITVDSMINCRAESGGIITANGKHGSIIGGTVKAQNSILARNIGSEASSRTDVEVGIPIAKMTRLEFLREETERVKKNSTKLKSWETTCSVLKTFLPKKKR